MTQLDGLPGTDGKPVDAHDATSRTDAVRALRDGARAVTASGDEGALNVWKDDEGWYRCEFDQRRVAIDQKRLRYLAHVDQWIKDWWPRLGR